MNVVCLVGRLATDVDVRSTTGGQFVANFRLAVNRPFGDREADFFPIVAWRKTAEFCGNHLQKGRMVSVEGRLQVRSWDQDGVKRYITEVVASNVNFVGGKGEQGSGEEQGDDVPW